MPDALAAFLFVLWLPAEAELLKTPKDLGQTTMVDVTAVVFIYGYDNKAGKFVLAEQRIVAVEGEIIEKEFVARLGGQQYPIPLADLSQDVITDAAAIHRKAVKDYIKRRGYIVQ